MSKKLIVVSGLPGSGKSTLAEALAQQLQIPVFAKDWLEAPLLRTGLVERSQLGRVGYELLISLIRRQLQFGQSAILDSVAGRVEIRDAWRELAAEFDACWIVIECVCSDEGIHRDRLVGRDRGIPGWYELEWADVERSRGYFVPWDEDRLVVDSVRPIDENVDRALRYIRSSS